MAFKDFRTRRSLRLELENRIETIDRRNKTIAVSYTHLTLPTT